MRISPRDGNRLSRLHGTKKYILRILSTQFDPYQINRIANVVGQNFSITGKSFTGAVLFGIFTRSVFI